MAWLACGAAALGFSLVAIQIQALVYGCQEFLACPVRLSKTAVDPDSAGGGGCEAARSGREGGDEDLGRRRFVADDPCGLPVL
jgi:hypothetical protein